MNFNFINNIEKGIQKKFLNNGYYKFNVLDKNKLNFLWKLIIFLSIIWLKIQNMSIYIKHINDLNQTHKFIHPDQLNDFRIFIYESINKMKNFKKIYFELGRKYIEIICGNELVMQKKCNLSIQFPKDKSSLLPLHADVWTGDSEYELVFWLPLVDVYKTKSMFILPPKLHEKYQKNFKKNNSINSLYNKVKKDLKWINLNYGQGIVFTQNLMHGNIINKEKTTRWSFNCRFKAIFSPYRDKEIGSFFTPITIKPITLLGKNYKFPK